MHGYNRYGRKGDPFKGYNVYFIKILTENRELAFENVTERTKAYADLLERGYKKKELEKGKRKEYCCLQKI